MDRKSPEKTKPKQNTTTTTRRRDKEREFHDNKSSFFRSDIESVEEMNEEKEFDKYKRGEYY